PTVLYPLSLHDALPISAWGRKLSARISRSFVPRISAWAKLATPCWIASRSKCLPKAPVHRFSAPPSRNGPLVKPCAAPSLSPCRSEEHTSELQSLRHLV